MSKAEDVRILSVVHEGTEYRCKETKYNCDGIVAHRRSEWLACDGSELPSGVAEPLWQQQERERQSREKRQNRENRARLEALRQELWPASPLARAETEMSSIRGPG